MSITPYLITAHPIQSEIPRDEGIFGAVPRGQHGEMTPTEKQKITKDTLGDRRYCHDQQKELKGKGN
jgi:hypothetical protein